MNYYGAKELAESFRTVRKNTIQAAEDIPEANYSFQAAPGTRSIEKTFVHLALGHRFQLQVHSIEKRFNFDGFDFPKLIQELQSEEAKPRTKAEVIALLRDTGETWAAFLDSVSEDFLAESFTMPPGASPARKSRFEMLLSTKEHEMHHRGQIMLMQRMLGIVPHLTRQFQERMARSQAASQNAAG